MRFGLSDITGIYSPIVVGVPEKQAHRNHYVGRRLINRSIHTIERDVDGLMIGHVGERYRHHVSCDSHHPAITYSTASYGSCAHGYLGLRASSYGDVDVKGHDHCEVVSCTATAAFHPSCSSSRKNDIKRTRRAVNLSRDRARHRRGSYARVEYLH